MKNYQKNPKNLFMASSCMCKQLTATVYDNLNKWHLKCLIWSLNLNLWFKSTQNLLLLAALIQITSCCHVTFMHHIVALHWLCFLLYCRKLSPLDRRGFDDEFDDTDEELYYLQKCQASKTPLFIPIQSHSLAPGLFYYIRTTTIQLLLVAVVEPLILCMTCHCHSK